MLLSGKPLASLSSGLLARKGQAKPAMRPQAYATLSSVTPVDDLGWNDMGVDAAEPAPELPQVLIERAALIDEVEQEVVEKVAPVETTRATVGEPVSTVLEPGHEMAAARLTEDELTEIVLPTLRNAARGKAAFTLRLDTHRHLRLRLASAVSHRSSQALLTAALDTLLDTLPEVEELARRCSSPAPMGDPE